MKDILRSLHGFLIHFEEDEARVAFDANGEIVEYMLPANNLKDAKITERNQPFEMDEIRTELGTQYVFRPLAPAGSGIRESLGVKIEPSVIEYFK